MIENVNQKTFVINERFDRFREFLLDIESNALVKKAGSTIGENANEFPAHQEMLKERINSGEERLRKLDENREVLRRTSSNSNECW